MNFVLLICVYVCKAVAYDLWPTDCASFDVILSQTISGNWKTTKKSTTAVWPLSDFDNSINKPRAFAKPRIKFNVNVSSALFCNFKKSSENNNIYVEWSLSVIEICQAKNDENKVQSRVEMKRVKKKKQHAKNTFSQPFIKLYNTLK